MGKTIQGKGVAPGVAKGPLCFLRRPDAAVSKMRTGALGAEQARLTAALAASAAQLEALAEQCRGEAEEAASLFETHAMLVEDEDFLACIQSVLEEEQCTAEYAVERAGETFAAQMAGMDDPYLRERAADIRDVAGRIRDNLMGAVSRGIEAEEPVILAAEDLAPSETLQLDKSKILAFVTRGGSANSHTAILARAMGIPAVCAVGAALSEQDNGALCYLDGETGQVFFAPEGETARLLEEKRTRQQEEKARLESLREQEDITPDGRRMELYCNIGAPEDVAAVRKSGGRGIGLFRSEFLYLRARDFPTEEVQFAAYREVLSGMEGRRVVIRTLDIGADKQVDYFGLHREENPALGVRAIRICLNRPEVFRTQLRALYRASAYGKLAIMFPMIASLWEVRACQDICRSVREELEQEGIPFDPEVKLGVMIETPAAVLIAGELAREVDFFSVGTNDLTQYLLACDRQSSELGRFFDPHHPALLRALKLTADAAHRAGIWVGICGELAADVSLLPTFLAMGIDELSVSPGAVLPLRAALRQTVAGACTLEKLK